eukprot:TRINITY_DN868_c0_g1_i7.p2 TRINITY_DN868_c0_g1~~TRINITY_DN868_c0_g1_i7.p2  ORF type:complete len:113 (-),score=35.99 TRINITY_DN868_c0_g1_i7:316-654(-)
MYPSKFYSLGFCDRLQGRCLKFFQRFLIIINYLVLFLMIIQWVFLIAGVECEDQTARKNIRVTHIVTTIVWVVLHFGGFFVKGCLYYESFMYDPDPADGSAFVTYAFKKCGP